VILSEKGSINKRIRNIVVLDSYTLNPGDLSWDELNFLGTCTIYDWTSPHDVLERSQGANFILTNKTIINRNAIENLPDLQYIGVMATGYNVVDLNAAREHHITVTNVPEYGTNSVVEMVFAMLLEMTRQVGYHAETVRNRRWTKSRDFCYWDKPLIELNSLTMGIIGYGKIGHAVAHVALAFGMKVLAYDIVPITTVENGIIPADLYTVFAKSDVVSLHCPLTPESLEIINKESLALMKKTAFLINTGRGPLIHESDLAEALNSGTIAGAGLDVLLTEPPRADNPLLTAKNCFITPHIAWATLAARKRLMNIVVENIRAFIQGNLRNVVS